MFKIREGVVIHRAKQERVKVNISKEIFSPIFRPYIEPTTRNLVLYGGAGSGKSVFTAQKVIYRCLKEPGHKFLVIRKVANTLRDSVYAELKRVIDDWGIEKLTVSTVSPLSIKFLNGSEIIFRGIDDKEKIKSISGITSVWIEEASELTKEDYNQLQLRVRGKRLKWKVEFIITFNPISEHSWLKKMFFDEEQPNTTVLKTTYLDNPFLDDNYIQTLENLKRIDENYYNIYALGHWGSLGNLIFKHWITDNLDEYEDSYFDDITYAVDYGWNDETALLKVGRKGDTIYVLDELYEQHLTNTDLIKKMHRTVNKDYMIYADSAEPARTRDIQREGFKIKSVKKGKDSIRHGIDFIKSHNLVVNTKCTNLIKELQTYKWKEDKDGNTKDEPVDFMNHAIDALRYALENERLARRPKNKAKTITKGMLGI